MLLSGFQWAGSIARVRQVAEHSMKPLRLLSYNVRRCLGVDGLLWPARIAKVIAQCEPDIVALQELDVGRLRSDGVDQPAEIASILNMHSHFHPAMQVFEELYGNAILTAAPSQLVRKGILPAPRGCEPRGVIWVRTFVQGYSLDIVTTHLGITSLQRRLQCDVLLGTDWIGGAGKLPHLIVAGDFNCLPRSRTWNRFALALGGDHPTLRNRAAATFPSTMPLLRLDHIFVTSAVEIVAMHPVRTPLTRIASDHLPLMMEFNLRPPDWRKEKSL